MPPFTARNRDGRRTPAVVGLLVAALLACGFTAWAQGFPNVPQTPGALIAGPIAPEQGRTAIIAWHGERIVSVPEPPGSQPGADVQIRVVDISDPQNPDITILPDTAFGFNAHGYFQYGAYLFIGPHCLNAALGECTGVGDLFRDSLRIGGPGTFVGTSQLTRASMENDAGLPVGGYNRSGSQSPWVAEQWWTYDFVEGEAYFGVRRSLADWVYDWSNGGAPTGPAITARWDHLGQTSGTLGFPFIMGNLLIYAADQSGSGVAVYDISDLANPVLLDVLKNENPGGYWPEIYGHYIFFPRRDNEGGPGSQAGYMVVDFEDPTDLRVVADRNLTGSNQYVTFQDEYAFMNNYKIDMRTFDVVLTLPTGLQPDGVTRIDASQFALPLGNLVVTGGYGADGPGLAIFAHQAEPDTRSPYVAYHVPRPDTTGYSIHCPITLSIPETLRTETIVDGVSLIVRPLNGSPIATWHAFSEGKLLTVTPRQVLQENTTYEVVLTSGILDAAGNGLEPYSFRFSTGSSLGGGNQPPAIDAIQATPAVASPGALVDLSWTGTDPEGAIVQYRVDYGDGSPSTTWSSSTSVSHTYTEAGHYQVTVQGRDPLGASAARSRTITIAPAPAAPGSTASSQMALNPATDRLYVVNPDTNTVSAVNTSTQAKLWEAAVDGDPRGVAQAADGTLWVVCRDSDTIAILNDSTGATVATVGLDYGSAPVAIAPVPGGATLLVSCEGDQMLRRFSAATRAQTGSVALGPWPRAIAVTASGTRALVTRFISPEHVGQVYDVSLAGGMSLTRTIRLDRDKSVDSSASSRGVPNYLAGIRIAPDGQWAWVVGKKDNTNKGTFFDATRPPGQDNTVRAQLMLIDLVANAEDRTRRLDIDNSESPTAVAFSERGDYAFIALQGNGQIAVVDVLDFMRADTPGTIHTRWGTGLAPQGVLLDETEGRLYVSNFMGRSVTVLEASAFLVSGSANVPHSAIATVAAERLHPEVLLGKQVFYNASDKRMSAEGYISCATCHVDGGHDGRTFDFTSRGEGFRNTTDLRGRSGIGHGAVHWSANFDEIQDFENDIRNSFGGTGFLSDVQFAATGNTLGAPKAGLNGDLDALAAYVTSLGSDSLPRSPHRNADGTLSAAATSGQALFALHNCGTCHTPATDFTDRQTHNVGTLRASSGQRLSAPLTGIDTPTLLGVHASAPYFHDGSAATLEEVLTIAGGRLEQAEDGIFSNGAYAEDVNWLSMKDWHGSQFVTLDINDNGPFQGISRRVAFDDVASSIAGPGFIEVRYNSAYGNSMLGVIVNGVSANTPLPQTPNSPSYEPNEWRTVRIPVTYQAGMNSFVFLEAVDTAQLLLDDILFCTPGDLVAAGAHVRGFNSTELANMVAYLQSLDGTDAAHPQVRIVRDGEVADGGTDAVEFSPLDTEVTLVYTIENDGTGPLNLGQFFASQVAGGTAAILRQPDPAVPAGGSTEMEVRLTMAGDNASVEIAGSSDSPNASDLEWTVQATRSSTSAVASWHLY